MTDGEPGMTRKQKIAHWTNRLLVPVLVVSVVVSVTDRGEVAARYAGGVLELLGFLVAAYGLEDKLARFSDRPGLRERVRRWGRRAWRWIKGLFGWEPEGKTVSVGGAGTISGGGSIRVSQETASDASLEHRVEVLEQQVDSLRSQIEEVRRESRKGRAELKNRIEGVRKDIREVEEKAENLVTQLAIGSLHWEATGLFWFALGVIFGTWPAVIPGA